MAWHPECRVGVIGLANGRYAGPYAAVVEATARLAASGAFPRQLRVEAHPEIWSRIRPLIDGALIGGDITPIIPSLASNVEQDRALASRAAEFTGLSVCVIVGNAVMLCLVLIVLYRPPPSSTSLLARHQSPNHPIHRHTHVVARSIQRALIHIYISCVHAVCARNINAR